jgi:hypothetical protein
LNGKSKSRIAWMNLQTTAAASVDIAVAPSRFRFFAANRFPRRPATAKHPRLRLFALSLSKGRALASFAFPAILLAP